MFICFINYKLLLINIILFNASSFGRLRPCKVFPYLPDRRHHVVDTAPPPRRRATTTVNRSLRIRASVAISCASSARFSASTICFTGFTVHVGCPTRTSGKLMCRSIRVSTITSASRARCSHAA